MEENQRPILFAARGQSQIVFEHEFDPQIFAPQLIKEIGRQFFRVERYPFFGSNRTRKPCHDVGKEPVAKAGLYILIISSFKEEELKKLEDFTCVRWINEGFRVKETESSSLGLHKTILRTKANDDNGRLIQKKSKKIGCNATIMVTCRISDPSIVEFKRKNDHNHIPRPYSDLEHVSTSDTFAR
ncbi:hypothetical protein RO3G_09352 [Rhizopus delemar RA 99-880]|uniref:FAR1 domain-containing protein n=1 Tax=Rhizopus delemar (strain RA 99-880 / ATCC MYA-4621 / FGSC 9543 / NRRL 43880) TaxID=246409 RepID=I1C862_RHIO9|nr:hypothetical protein RO3G_09352 [Rhizopus delemar RA 99-880]|eukprot:EIE84642.1 hypothetical protein RO3G_09352 [Rhizopus delemar RA 99-880]